MPHRYCSEHDVSNQKSSESQNELAGSCGFATSLIEECPTERAEELGSHMMQTR